LTVQPPLIIDSFAGGGGASTGIENALGRAPDVAINHSAAALALHAANHPETLHLDSNIWDVKPREVTKGRKVGLLWASPDCKHFSKAKGGAPRDRNIRDLAWVVVDWAEQVQPDVIAMENVEEFVTWGPLGEDGQPIKEFAGMTFDTWVKRLKRAGYRVQWRELRACDYGAPTIRKRWFLIARRDGRPITWPKPTHGDPKSPEVRRGKLLPWRTAASCIDWALPCPSIFATGPEIMERHGLRAVRPLARNTMARIARGMKRYVLESDRPFLVNLTHGGRTEPADEPFRTITGAHRGEKAVVVPSIVGCGGRAGQSRPRGGNEPFATVTAKADACLVAASITRFNSGATGQDMRDPLATVTANSWIKKPGGAAPLGILSPYLASIAHGDSGGRREYPMAEPLGTVTVGGIQHALIAPNLMSLKGTARRDSPADAPHPTVLAGGGHSALIAPALATFYGHNGGRGIRSADLSDPLRTVTVENRHALLAPHLMTMRNAQKPFNGADGPTHTVTAGGAGLSTIAAFLAQQNGGPRMEAHSGHDPREPISTIAASGSHQTPIAAFLTKYYGQGTGATMDEPCHTVTVDDRFGHVQAALEAPPFTADHETRAREVATFLRDHDAWDGGEFVTLEVGGQTFVVVDIGMRMLTPRELFNAQGFPPDYVIEGVWQGIDTDAPTFKPFPKDVQVSCCGNSVCPPLAEAIIRENCAHLAATTEQEAMNG
jgi:DNA (cytosine-5)-methyltransferase 1